MKQERKKELVEAIKADQSVIRENNNYEYVDNEDEQAIFDAQKAAAVQKAFENFDGKE